MSEKSRVRYIVLERAEGRNEECGVPEVVKGYDEANAVIAKMAKSIPEKKEGVSYKVDFVIMFYDGETYKGTYDMFKNDMITADLSGHIRRINDISRYPEWIRENAIKSGRVEEFKNFAKTHDLGF